MHNHSGKQREDTNVLGRSIVEVAREKPPAKKEPPKGRPEKKEPPKDPSRKKEPPKEPPPKKLVLKFLEDWAVLRVE